MTKKAFIKYLSVTVLAAVLIIGYVFFDEKSLQSSGKSNTSTVVQQLSDGDSEGVKQRLADFVGDGVASDDYEKALLSIDHVSRLIDEEGVELSLVGDSMRKVEGTWIYGAVYILPATQGGEDFLLITMSRRDGVWVLANTQLAASNPLE